MTNNEACTISETFEKRLDSLNREMEKKKQKILIFIDNYPAQGEMWERADQKCYQQRDTESKILEDLEIGILMPLCYAKEELERNEQIIEN